MGLFTHIDFDKMPKSITKRFTPECVLASSVNGDGTRYRVVLKNDTWEFYKGIRKGQWCGTLLADAQKRAQIQAHDNS